LKTNLNRLAAGDESTSAVATQRDTAALSEGLDDRLDIKSNLNGKTGDGVDLGTVVDGVGVNSAGDIDGVTPSGIDLSDSSTSVHDESTVAVVGALARPGEVPVELNVSHAKNVVEIPLEGTPLVILEALELTPGDALGDSTSPVSLVINNRLTVLDDLPNGLADGDDGGDIDVLGGDRSDLTGVFLRLGLRDGEPDILQKKLVVVGSSKASQSQNSKYDVLHCVSSIGFNPQKKRVNSIQKRRKKKKIFFYQLKMCMLKNKNGILLNFCYYI